MRVWAVISICALLAACTMGAQDGADKPAPGSNPITGDAIAVTPLDSPAAPAEAAAIGAAAVAVVAEQPGKADQAPPPRPADLTTATTGATTGDTAAAPAEAAPEEAAPAPPPASPEELACIRKGGQWVGAGKSSGAKTCVKQTRDSGKRCTRESQCEGACLARSGTCAPVTPLFGCNDVLQDNGVMVTLCID